MRVDDVELRQLRGACVELEEDLGGVDTLIFSEILRTYLRVEGTQQDVKSSAS